MLIAVGVWSVLGSIPDLVDGQGTLFRGERIYDIKATMGGSILTMDVRAGSASRRARRLRSSSGRGVIEVRNADRRRPDAEPSAKKSGNRRRGGLPRTRWPIEGTRRMAGRLNDPARHAAEQWALQKQLVDQGIKAPKDLLKSSETWTASAANR